jgi:hypothetical protein
MGIAVLTCYTMNKKKGYVIRNLFSENIKQRQS